NADRVQTSSDSPFIHRQTLASAVRFTTVELGELEGKLAQAGERALALELELFEELVREVSAAAERVSRAAGALATLDVSSGLGALAVERRSVRPEVDEFPVSELETAPSVYVKPPRVAAAPAALECRHWKTVELPDVVPGQPGGHYVLFGEVVGIYIDDTYVKDGMVDTGAMQPLARLGYMQYAVVTPETVFDLNRPNVDENGEVKNNDAKEWDGKYR
ncbi:MAG: hypothetical protein VW881_08135, partial [Alphaproteobacteria bacterium]